MSVKACERGMYIKSICTCEATIDMSYQHGGQDHVLQTVLSAGVACLLVTAEGLIELIVCFIPKPLGHIHLAAFLADDTHCPWICDSSGEIKRLGVELLQPGRVAGDAAELDLETQDLQEQVAIVN